MLHVLTPMGFGDCLLTLSLLERVRPDPARCTVLGTAVTQRVAALLRRPMPVTALLPDAASFYIVGERGLWRAVRDLAQLRWGLARHTRPGDTIAVERVIFRNKLLVPWRRRVAYAPPTRHVYDDRRRWMEGLFGQQLAWTPTAPPARPPGAVLLNPCARFADRCLAPETVGHLLAIAREHGWRVTLLDPCRRYGALRDAAAHYFEELPLEQAAQRVKAADLYIGPDSFFIHLAYYHGVPCFGFFIPHRQDFLLPGMEGLGNFMDFESARERSLLQPALERFLAA